MADGSNVIVSNQGRRLAPPEVWAAVRKDYLAGVTALECCRRHGVRITALRDRAAREGWRRMDLPWIPPNPLDARDEGVELEFRTQGDLDQIEMRELSFVAFRRMMRAVLRGDAAEALRWRRVRLAMDAEEEEVQRFLCQEETLLARRRREAGDPDSSDSPDSLFQSET